LNYEKGGVEMFNGIEIWAIIGTVAMFILLLAMDTILEKERVDDEARMKVHIMMILVISINAVMSSYIVFIF